MAEGIDEILNRAWREANKGGTWDGGYYQGVKDALYALGYQIESKTTFAVTEAIPPNSPESESAGEVGYMTPNTRVYQLCRLGGVFRNVKAPNGGTYTLYRFLTLPKKEYQIVFNIHEDVLINVPVGTNVFLKGDVIRNETVNGIKQNVVRVESIWSEDQSYCLWSRT